MKESIVVGTVNAVLSMATISNLSGKMLPVEEIAKRSTLDTVFGTGYNSMAAAAAKSVTLGKRFEERGLRAVGDSRKKVVGHTVRTNPKIGRREYYTIYERIY